MDTYIINKTDRFFKQCPTRLNRKLPAIFYVGKYRDGQYLFDSSHMVSSIPEKLPKKTALVLPLVVDTEYVGLPTHWLLGFNPGRYGLTSQWKGIHEGEGVILASPENKQSRHPVASSGFHLVDYLNQLGFKASIKRFNPGTDDAKVRSLTVVLYAHFALAEAMQIVHGEYREDFRNLMRAEEEKDPSFKMTRRLMSSTPCEYGGSKSYVALPWLLEVNGEQFRVNISWVDTCALHSQVSYKDLCEATGVKLEYKDNFSSKEKSRMDVMYSCKPEEFDQYALGDLHVYDTLKNNAELFGEVYETLGISEFFQPPKLTLGATVRDMLKPCLRKKLGIANDDKGNKAFNDVIEKYIKPASAAYLRLNTASTTAMLAKVEGGRCRNARPKDIRIISGKVSQLTSKHNIFYTQCIVDVDISGCYGEGQRNQEYPIGKPVAIGFNTSSSRNGYPSAEQVLKQVGKELVPGLWVMRVSTSEPLKFEQDYFASWFLPNGHGENLMAKYLGDMEADTEKVDKEFDEEDGSLKIFKREILNGCLTHDGLQWMNSVCSASQRKELLEKLKVKALIFYPKSCRLESYQQLVKGESEWSGENNVTFGENGSWSISDNEYHGWISFNMGELLINTLLAARKKYPKKTPLNTIFKMSINTLYGDMTSKFFDVSNVVVGNNITARARALAWYMEKGLYGFQTITDGCACQLNNVVVGSRNGRRLTALDYAKIHESKETHNIKFGSLLKDGQILLQYDENKKGCLRLLKNTGEVTALDNSESQAWINKNTWKHLQELFPNVDVLNAPSTSLKVHKETGTYEEIPRTGQFEFEMKDFYHEATFHGSANYCFENVIGENIKFRSYEGKKDHEGVVLDGDKLVVTDRFANGNNPAKTFLKALKNPKKVSRSIPFVKEGIIKVSDYKQRLKTWESLELVPGDSFYKCGLLCEFSLSQFTFKTMSQYVSWDKAITRLKDRTGQSLEQFFLNKDGSLNYEKMVETIYKMVHDGVENPVKHLDPDRNKTRRDSYEHPSFKTRQKLSDILKTPRCMDDFDDTQE